MKSSTNFLLFLTGAILPWRFAIGVMASAPILGFILLCFCPETPTWYMQVGKENDARLSLKKLRGETNKDIIEAEFNRISLNLKAQQKELELNSKKEEKFYHKITSLASDATFIKPFGFLMVLFLIGMEWTSLPAIAFYMVPLLM